MANLVQRLTGDLLGLEQDQKIPIHAFLGALNEYKRTKITSAEVISAFDLDTAQTTQLETLKDLLIASPNPTEFMRVFKDLMYLGETNTHFRYRDITFVQSRLQVEVTDQGGTLP